MYDHVTFASIELGLVPRYGATWVVMHVRTEGPGDVPAGTTKSAWYTGADPGWARVIREGNSYGGGKEL